MESFN
jgi:hypothetical protein